MHQATPPFRLSMFLRLILPPAGCIAGYASAATPPPNLQGTWEVVQVAVDQRDQPHWLYFPADPRLLGRELHLSDSVISLNNDSRDCSKPVLTVLPKTELQKYIGQKFPRAPQPATPVHPTLSDFGLTLPDSSVQPLQVNCDPDTSQWNGAWIIPIAPDRLLTNFDNNGYVLVLRRHLEADPIKPSFACNKAQSTVEHAICTSVALAGYDRSVTAAYRHALTVSGDNATSIKQEQLDWLKTRNACGADVACLEKSMRDRVDQLMQQ